MSDSENTSVLFSTTPVVTESQAPVIVVGLPRSGSSFLSHVLSALDGWYVWDDLYLLQRVKLHATDGLLSAEQVHGLMSFLGWTIRAKLNHDDHFTRPNLSMDDVDRMVEAMRETFSEGSLRWEVLLEEWMTRLARHHGCTHWGYKTPQDFHHMDELTDVFPDVKFVYVVRDPRRVMASYKFVNSKDGNPDQYHPFVYTSYWKMAYDRVAKFEASGRAPVLTVKFEELVADPDAAAETMAKFLDTRLIGKVPEQGRNTSFAGGKRKDITNTEKWICQIWTGRVMDALGYEKESSRPALSDIPDMFKTTYRFIAYQCTRVMKKKHTRGTIGTYIRALVGSK